VTGTLTGRGGDIIILDDVIKPERPAPRTPRESVKEWFRSTFGLPTQRQSVWRDHRRDCSA